MQSQQQHWLSHAQLMERLPLPVIFSVVDRIIPMRARRSMMRKVLCAGVAVLLMSGTAMAASAGGDGGGNASAGGGEARPTSQSTQSRPTVVAQNPKGAINEVNKT